MKKRFSLTLIATLCLSLTSLFAHVQVDQGGDLETKPATLKVRLFSSEKGALVEAKGAFDVINTMNGRKLSWGGQGKRFYMYGHDEGIKWGENFLGIFQVTLIPKSEATRFLVNGIEYPGAIEVYNAQNKLVVINELTVEDFLKAHLAPQISHDYNLSTYEALAIAMRTHYYHLAEKNGGSFWHLDAKEIGYNGSGLNLQNLKLEAGILGTKYVVMNHNKHTFPSGFSGNCAGKTASYAQVLRIKSSCPSGVISPYAQEGRKLSGWKQNVPLTGLAKQIKLNRITNVETFKDPASHKVYATRFFDGIHSVDMPISKLQDMLGRDQIKSNDFNVSIQGDKLSFVGFGEGLGVGICLYSADKMADKSDDALKILSFFYPNVEFVKIKSLPLAPRKTPGHVDYLPGNNLSEGPRKILHK